MKVWLCREPQLPGCSVNLVGPVEPSDPRAACVWRLRALVLFRDCAALNHLGSLTFRPCTCIFELCSRTCSSCLCMRPAILIFLHLIWILPKVFVTCTLQYGFTWSAQSCSSCTCPSETFFPFASEGFVHFGSTRSSAYLAHFESASLARSGFSSPHCFCDGVHEETCLEMLYMPAYGERQRCSLPSMRWPLGGLHGQGPPGGSTEISNAYQACDVSRPWTRRSLGSTIPPVPESETQATPELDDVMGEKAIASRTRAQAKGLLSNFSRTIPMVRREARILMVWDERAWLLCHHRHFHHKLP